MSWVRSDDNEPNHAKVFRAGVAAYGFFQAAKCYCSRNLTDGFIPIGDLSIVFPGVTFKQAAKFAMKLTECKLFEVEEKGYRVHDYLHYNPSRDQIVERREQRMNAGKVGGLRSGAARRSNSLPRDEANAKQVASPQTNPDPSHPIPTRPIPETEPENIRPRGADLSPHELIDLFNKLTPDETPAVVTRSPERLRKARQYLTKFPKRVFWEETFGMIHKSLFLRGLSAPRAGHEKFVADFDWLLSKGKDGTENVVKVHDGKYA